MKNSEAAAKNKNGKSESSTVSKTNMIVAGKNHIPGEEEIRELAEIIYWQRLDRNEPGTSEEDWLKAEEYLTYNEL